MRLARSGLSCCAPGLPEPRCRPKLRAGEDRSEGQAAKTEARHGARCTSELARKLIQYCGAHTPAPTVRAGLRVRGRPGNFSCAQSLGRILVTVAVLGGRPWARARSWPAAPRTPSRQRQQLGGGGVERGKHARLAALAGQLLFGLAHPHHDRIAADLADELDGA